MLSVGLARWAAAEHARARHTQADALLLMYLHRSDELVDPHGVLKAAWEARLASGVADDLAFAYHAAQMGVLSGEPLARLALIDRAIEVAKRLGPDAGSTLDTGVVRPPPIMNRACGPTETMDNLLEARIHAIAAVGSGGLLAAIKDWERWMGTMRPYSDLTIGDRMNAAYSHYWNVIPPEEREAVLLEMQRLGEAAGCQGGSNRYLQAMAFAINHHLAHDQWEQAESEAQRALAYAQGTEFESSCRRDLEAIQRREWPGGEMAPERAPR